MRLRIFVFVFFFLSLFFGFEKKVYAQVNGNNVGPVLPDPKAGAKVVDANSFTGAVTVINDINDIPHNSVPSKSNNPVILRVNIDNGSSNAALTKYASLLNGSADFPNGAVVVLGNEENNLSQEWHDTHTLLQTAGSDYADKFNIFGQALSHGKFKLAPAPPDMYNGDFDPIEWLIGFRQSIDCGQIDTLVAHVYKVTPARSIGGSSDKTYLFFQSYIDAKCGGKTVNFFSEWGGDPKASVSEQVNFINTTNLPSGITGATVLIANNCNGNNGSSGTIPWLYYLPKSPYVFNADGGTIDLVTCGASNQGTVAQQFTPQLVPCDADGTPPLSDPEYHSLRPYPASPCYKQVKDTALFCGNDVVVKHTFDEPDCDPGNPAPHDCTYHKTAQTASVTVDLKNAKLPILGNTEDVPNGTWTSTNTSANNLTAAQRMNNYVSWYLNGVINRAEEDFSSWDSTYLVNFSGPLNKLLSWDSQFTVRDKSIDNAVQTINKQKDLANDTSARHDQTVGCPILEQGGGAVPCYLYISRPILGLMNFLNSIGVKFIDSSAAQNEVETLKEENRLVDWSGHKPPDENDPKYATDFQAYWRDYLGWLDQICTPKLFGTGFYFCVNSPAVSIWSMLFSHIPQSTTEDRIGGIFTDNTDSKKDANGFSQLQHTTQADSSEVFNVSFTPTSAVADNISKHNLYFAHTQEVAELAKNLQDTFATKSTTDTNWEKNILDDINIHEPQSDGGREGIGNSNHCEPADSRTNPGDNLYGDLQSAPFNEQQIGGTLQYDATFTCTISSSTDQSCVSQCIAAKGGSSASACQSQCTTGGRCKHDVFVSLGIYTKTPNAQENFDRLVGCDGGHDCINNSKETMGIFQRFYPKSGPNSPISEIKDIPGIATVGYSAPGNTALAGDPSKSRDGAQAQLFFPHLGSIEEYFLQGIQKALRPKDTETEPLAGQPLQCSVGSNVNTHQVLGSSASITDKTIALAIQVANATCTPPELLIGIMAKESRGLANGDTPYSGDPTEIGTRNCAGTSYNCGAFSYNSSDIVAQKNERGDQFANCLTAIGLSPSSMDAPNSQTELGVSMCAAGVNFWSAAVCAKERPCSGGIQSMSPDEQRRAALVFHYNSTAACNGEDPSGVWTNYNGFIQAYTPDVARVRAQCSK